MKKYLTGCGLALILSGCGGTPPVDIRSSKIADNGFGAAEAPFLSITATAKSDDLEIREITVNKGNCQRMNSSLVVENAVRPLKTVNPATVTIIKVRRPQRSAERRKRNEAMTPRRVRLVT